MTKQDLYKEYIQKCSSAPGSYNNYKDFKRIHECICEMDNLDDFSLYDIDDPNELVDLVKRLKQFPKFKKYNSGGDGVNSGKNQYSCALDNYEAFLRAKKFGSLFGANYGDNPSASLKSESEPIYYLNHFAQFVLKNLSDVDELLTLQPFLSEKNDWYWIERTDIKSGLFRKQFLVGQTFDKPIKYIGNDVYVSMGWDKDDKLNAPSFGVLKYIVDNFYSKYFRIEQRKNVQGRDIYVLITLDNKFNVSQKQSLLLPQSFNTYQSIFYGTPGSGKSYAVKTLIESKLQIPDEFVFRTTFFPDYDYAQFVGCYKPIRKRDEDRIQYKFVPQQFTKAYIKAWQNPTLPVFLIIEEINRGNCASIFGDLFQLLDRKDGISEYPINANEDLADYLIGILGEDSDGIKDRKLCLPNNFNIIATMNTSDQSLFPMDSAFKRRWDWKYFAIKDEGQNFIIDVAHGYNWWDFVQTINTRIYQATESEDKKIGYWFVKAVDNKISVDLFVSKVLFYLWNDVFKDLENNPFGVVKFADMYKSDGQVDESKVKEFLDNLFVPESDDDNIN